MGNGINNVPLIEQQGRVVRIPVRGFFFRGKQGEVVNICGKCEDHKAFEALSEIRDEWSRKVENLFGGGDDFFEIISYQFSFFRTNNFFKREQS